MPTILRYEDYTIGWICALPVEVLAALFMLDEEHEGVFPARPGDDNDYIPGTIGGHNVVIVGLPKKSTGTVSAASLVSQMRQSFPKLRYGLMVGIGAGVPGRDLRPDVRLGDVVVGSPPDGSDDAQGVIGYELGKETVEGFVRKNWLCPTDRRFRTALDSIQTQARLRGSYTFVQHLEAFKKWESGNEFSYPATAKDYLYEADCEKGCTSARLVAREPRNSRDPVVHYGLIASGDKLIKNAKLRDALRDKYNIMCFEMETAGLLNILPVAVIRGVCDYADTYKNDEWHGYAAATAAAFAKGLLYKIGPEVGSDYNQSPPTPRTPGPPSMLARQPEVEITVGCSVNDAERLVILSRSTLDKTRRACGEYDELTCEVASMLKVLRRLRKELKDSRSGVHRASFARKMEFEKLSYRCERILTVVDSIVTKYNERSAHRRSGKLMARITLGDGTTKDLTDITQQVSTLATAMLINLNVCCSESRGNIEQRLEDVSDLRGIGLKVEWATANLAAKASDGTVWTSYEDDDEKVWRSLRRSLIDDGYGSSVIQKHQQLIREYVAELGNRGALDLDDIEEEPEEEELGDDNFTIRGTDDEETSAPDVWEDAQAYPTTEDIGTGPNGSTATPSHLRAWSRPKSNPFETGTIQEEQFASPVPANAVFTESNKEARIDVGVASVEPISAGSTLQTEITYDDSINSKSDSNDNHLQNLDPEQSPQLQMKYSSPTSEGYFSIPVTEEVATPFQPTQTTLKPLAAIGETIHEPILPTTQSKATDVYQKASIETIVDEDFLPNAHPYVYLNDEDEKSHRMTRDFSYVRRWRILEKHRNQPHNGYQKRPPSSDAPPSSIPNYVFHSTGTLNPAVGKQVPKNIHLRDAIGRKFAIPYSVVQTYQGMSDLITQAFLQKDVEGPHVLAGRYDLLSDRGDIIPPRLWSRLIKPGAHISMKMWPGIESVKEPEPLPEPATTQHPGAHQAASATAPTIVDPATNEIPANLANTAKPQLSSQARPVDPFSYIHIDVPSVENLAVPDVEAVNPQQDLPKESYAARSSGRNQKENRGPKTKGRSSKGTSSTTAAKGESSSSKKDRRKSTETTSGFFSWLGGAKSKPNGRRTSEKKVTRK